ncbi:MAG TPA: hypothetical protein PLF26_05625 [Blastocatellia bacterium]|nr:hypothetical protein [Blastocatellia bacterium]
MPRLRRFAALLLLPLFILLLPAHPVARAQEGSGIPLGGNRAPVVRRADLYCAGFISQRLVSPKFQVIGGENETEIHWFSTANVIYVDFGARDGAAVGQTLSICREKGKYENPFTGKNLGYYYEEVGTCRLIGVQRNVSIARIETTCDGIRISDTVRPWVGYVAPSPHEYAPLNRYDLPSGKLSGQIVLARYEKEFLGSGDIIYLDIGNKDGVALGQYYTVYRDPGKPEGPIPWGNAVTKVNPDFERRNAGFESDRYRGGDFSIQRGKDKEFDTIEDRTGLPRKVVGEAVIIRLEEKSATAVILRTTQEVNTGDYVELQ